VSRSLRLLLALVSLVSVCALAARDGRILAVALPLLAYIGAGLAASPHGVRLGAARSIRRTRIGHGESVEVTVTVQNDGPRIGELLLVDRVPAALRVAEGSARFAASLPAGGRVQWRYTVIGARGEHRWEALDAEAAGFGGLFMTREALPLPSRLLVLPVAERLSPLRIRPLQTRGFAGPIPSRMAGSGTQFLSVREYRLGDPLGRINGRLAARAAGALYTNEFEQERIADVGLVLDTRGQSYLEHQGGRLFEAGVSAALSLAEAFLKEGNRVALLGYGYGIGRVGPGLGKVQLRRITTALAHAATGWNYALESLDSLPTRMFPVRSQIVLVTPLRAGDGRMLRALRTRGYSLLVVSPVIPGDAGLGGSGGLDELARRIARLERTLLVAELRRAGVHVVDWPIDRPLSGTLRSALAREALDPRVRGLRR
jgi:uncharacterized protein (DUF58 family)